MHLNYIRIPKANKMSVKYVNRCLNETLSEYLGSSPDEFPGSPRSVISSESWSSEPRTIEHEEVQFTVSEVQRMLVSDDADEEENYTNNNGTQTGKGKGSYISKPDAVRIPKPVTTKRKKVKLMDWKGYHRLKTIYTFMEELERDYPAICTVYVIGKTVEGRDIKMLKISNSNATNKAVWVDGGIHSREWISSAVVSYIANILVKNFKEHSPSITRRDWFIVPVLNPDGYEYSHTKNRMWRKNKARFGGKCMGVDLNRNFSYGWGNNEDEGSSDDPYHVFYRGPSPFSEPESTAVRNVILTSNSKFEVFLSFHSYYESIIFPWGFKQEPCPHYLRLLEAGSVMSRAIFETFGFIYKVGSTKDLTYYACGTSIDWAYAYAKIPYSYMIELRSKRYKFRLPKNQIMETCIENWNALLCLMEYVQRHPIALG